MKKALVSSIVLVGALFFTRGARAHCEMPCGIYDDQTRFTIISEYIDTIEKSMRQINELSGAKPVNYNQLVRWVTNKEEHAERLQHIVSQYFLRQRIKPVESEKAPGYKRYVRQLILAHGLLVTAMQAKQTTDLSKITKLRTLLAGFKKAYFARK